MAVMVGLSLRTGIPWQYWARQDDRVIATVVDLIERSNGKRRQSDTMQDGRTPKDRGRRPGDFRVMSG